MIKEIKRENLCECANELINACIRSISNSSVKASALDFLDFLTHNEMVFEKAGGYWKNQQYFYVKYKNEFVCFILVNGKDEEKKFYPFTVWSDDSNSDLYSASDLDEHTISTAIKHIDICERCGACKGGTQKQIFGIGYRNVCRTTFRFINPNAEELECLKKLIILRKRNIERFLCSDWG